jgi:hypothetical protein
VGYAGKRFGVKKGFILIRINDTALDGDINELAFTRLRVKTPKPYTLLFMREPMSTQESNVEADRAMQEFGPKYVSSSILIIDRFTSSNQIHPIDAWPD